MTLVTLASFRMAREQALSRFGFPASGDRAADTCELREAHGSERARAEHFIAERYRRDFGARIEAFMPRLFSLCTSSRDDFDGPIDGALGLRSANGRLFVEQYLDDPIEQAILAATGERVERASIVEVGHFAGRRPGTMRAMIVLLTERLYREGTTWVAFAGTRALRNAFLRMNLRPIPLCAAARERLPEQARATWGTYYRHDPWVYAGPVHAGVGALAASIDELREQGA